METNEKICDEVSIETSKKKEKKVWYKRPGVIATIAGGVLAVFWANRSYKKTGSVKGAGKLMLSQSGNVVKKAGNLFGFGKKEENSQPQYNQNQNRRGNGEGRTYERPQYRGGNNGERKQQNV